MEDAEDSAFIIPNAPAGVSESDVSAFFADFYLPTPPRGQGIADPNKLEENEDVNSGDQEGGEEKKHLNFEDAKEDEAEEEKENDGDATESDREQEEALTEIQL